LVLEIIAPTIITIVVFCWLYFIIFCGLCM
jgi:hypothetical protein